jgi:hypothetical protein
VVGYSEEVDWLESASFDLLLLALLSERWRSDALFARIVDSRTQWAKALGLVVATKAKVYRA